MAFIKLLLSVLLVATSAMAQDATSGALKVTQAWSRATPPTPRVAVGYVTIANTGDKPDRLLSASSPMAERVEVHESTLVGGVARMRPVEKLDVAAGATIALKPGGLHLMLLQPRARLAQGGAFPITLVFERAGPVTAIFSVQAMGSTAAPQDGHEGHTQ